MTSKLLEKKPAEKLETSLSVSKIKLFESCPAAYRFSYIERLPKDDSKEYTIFGKFLHEVLEHFHLEIMKDPEKPLNLLMGAVFRQCFETWKSKLKIEQFSEAKQILTTYLEKWTRDTEKPTILATEKEFYIQIDEDILLTGVIDRIQLDTDSTIHVTDYKTSKSKKYLKKDPFQLMTYAFVVCLENENIEKVRTSYLLLKHNCELIEKTYDRAQILALESKFREVADEIKREKLFRPKVSKLCEYCDFLEHCPAGKQFVGVPENGKKAW